MSVNNAAIIVVAYNREEAVARLLGSLLAADYSGFDNVPLVISIDASDNPKVLAYANSFDWPYGAKRIIAHPSNLGLRKHVLSCGDLSLEYGTIIVLEDDLYVSPRFYQYSVASQDFYRGDSRIAGISLYTHRTNVNCNRPFEPLHDGSDIFFLQFASSWGQSWTATQWGGFRSWYDAEMRAVTCQDDLPARVISWPESSWLKYFIKYMVEMDFLFVYPRCALSTNFSDPGTHQLSGTALYQVPLQMSSNTFDWRFVSLNESACIYDSFFEIAPSSIPVDSDLLNGRKVVVDLYGTKPVSRMRADLALTSRVSSAPLKTYGCQLKPRAANLLLSIPGDDFCLTAISSIIDGAEVCGTVSIDYDINILPSKPVYLYALKSFVLRMAKGLRLCR